MALPPGARLGPYEIVAPLGAGGMGEVYSARDTRIGRLVAVKVLPPELETDPDRRRRFQHEAVAAGALNHPNVLVVHDVGHEAGRPYLVTELLEGRTLRDALRDGALPESTAVRYTAALLDGLASAHAQGIVHRDIKPENIFITSDDVPKLLDFGLARLPDGFRWASGSGATATAAGSMLGSVGYMAPEQVTGGAIDQRSDLFSMGVVLQEMLAGVAPFRGDTAIDVLNAIVNSEIEPPAAATAPLRAVLQRALQKAPARRFQSAADFAFALRLPRAEERADGRWPRRGLAAAAALLVLGLAAIAAVVLWPRRGEVVPTAAPVTFHQVTFQPGRVWSARFVPGGDTIVYSASWNDQPNRIYSARAAFPVPTDLHLPPADLLGVSKSGELALLLGRRWLQGMEPSQGVLARSAMSGSAARQLADNVAAGDWDADGQQLAAVREVSGRRQLEFPLGHMVYQTPGWIDYVRVSRDGTRVAFADHPLRSDDRGDIVVVERSGAITRLATGLDAARGLAWGPDGGELWASIEGRIVAFTLRGGQRVVYRDPRGISLQDVASDGRMLMVVDQKRAALNGRLAGDAAERELTWFDYSVARDISRDGKSLLFFEASEVAGADYIVGLWRAGETAPFRLGEGHAMSLSADGRFALAINLEGPIGLRILPTGAGDAREIRMPTLATLHWATWLPNGRQAIVSGNEPGRGPRLYIIDLTGRVVKAIGPEGTSYLANAVSPDGLRVAAQGADRQLTIYGMTDGAATVVAGVSPDEHAIGWSADGTSVYVMTPGIPCRVSLVNVATGARVPWRELMPSDPTGVVRISPVLVTPDGSAYAYTYARFLSTLYVVTGAR